MVSNTFVV